MKLRGKYSFCFFLLLSAAFSASLLSAAPRGKQELVQADSWIYDAIAALSLESGRVNLAVEAPLSISELQLILSEIDYESLSEAGKTQYKRINDYFCAQNWSLDASIMSVGLAPEVNLEGFYKSNADLPWVYDRYQRQPLIYTDATITIGDWVTMSTNVMLQENKGQMGHNDNYSNIPLSGFHADKNFPDTGYLSTGLNFTKDSGMNFRIGMGEQYLGRSLSGSVILSEYFTNSAWANLGFFTHDFRYDMNVIQYNVDKYMYSHRLVFRFFKKVEFSAMESVLINAPLELRFLVPWSIYHGLSARRDYSQGADYSDSNACALLAFTLSYAPVKYLRLYALYAQDQLQTAFERKNWPDDTTPNAISFQLGAETFFPYRSGYFHGWLEGTYTDPFMYIKQSPNWSMVRTYCEDIGDNAVFYEWAGSPFGPDTVAVQLNFGYEVPEKWSVAASYLFKACGEYSGTKVFTPELDWGGQDKVSGTGSTEDDSKWVYPDRGKEGGQEYAKEQQSWIAPHGIPEFVNRIALRGSWSPVKWVSVTAQPAFVFVFNRDNVSGKFDCGAEIVLSTKLTFVDLVRFNR